MASDPKVYVFEEVEKHHTMDDCWLIINGKVYDVSPFIEEHPGGEEVLLASTGKDATDDFEQTGHSDEAKDMLPKFCIGKIDSATVPLNIPRVNPRSSYQLDQTAASASKILQFIVPLFLLGLFYAIRRHTTEE